MKKTTYIFILFLTIINCLHAQKVLIGDVTTPSDAVTFQIDATDKGVLFPRIALQGRNSTAPLPTNTPSGTIVFNTATTGQFPNEITPGLYWWNSETTQWYDISRGLENVSMKYINSETSTNYNQTTYQNVKLFGQNVFNESSQIYEVNTTNHSVKIKRGGLYTFSVLLSFDRLTADGPGRVILESQLYVNNAPRGTAQFINTGYTTSINKDRGLFSHSFTEYLEIEADDVIEVKIKRADGTYYSNWGTASVPFLQAGDSSIAIGRIR